MLYAIQHDKTFITDIMNNGEGGEAAYHVRLVYIGGGGGTDARIVSLVKDIG